VLEQQPFGHDCPSQTHAPSAQRWPVAQEGPEPQVQPPLAEQPSLAAGSHAVQAAPPVPQVCAVRGRHSWPAQQPLGQVVASQCVAVSVRQVAEQPSPDRVFPSSHSSIGARTRLSPQIAGAPRVSVTATSCAALITTGCWSVPTTVASARPSTRTATVVPSSASGSRIAAVSWPLASARGGSGSVPGAKAGAPPARPEIPSAVSPSAGS
jgi:hypothetical protein